MSDDLWDIVIKAIEDRIQEWSDEGLSNEEIEDKLEQINLEKSIPDLVDIAAKDIKEFMQSHMFEIAYGHNASSMEFLAHQEQLWGKCFVASETMYVLAIESAELYGKFIDENVDLEQKLSKQYTFLTLQHIHGRACQQYLEIICLIRNGFADGAYARWRSMYELSCIAEFIKHNGEKIAEQYYKQSETNDKNYSWVKGASCFLGKEKKSYTFKDIQAECKFATEAWSKQYALACLVNHASPQGTFKRLANGKTKNIIPVGRSDYGIATAAEHAAICLQLITTFFLTVFSYIDGLARCKFLHSWVDVIQELYSSTEKDVFADMEEIKETDGGSK